MKYSQNYLLENKLLLSGFWLLSMMISLFLGYMDYETSSIAQLLTNHENLMALALFSVVFFIAFVFVHKWVISIENQ